MLCASVEKPIASIADKIKAVCNDFWIFIFIIWLYNFVQVLSTENVSGAKCKIVAKVSKIQAIAKKTAKIFHIHYVIL